jgi:hypothetical protein
VVVDRRVREAVLGMEQRLAVETAIAVTVVLEVGPAEVGSAAPAAGLVVVVLAADQAGDSEVADWAEASAVGSAEALVGAGSVSAVEMAAVISVADMEAAELVEASAWGMAVAASEAEVLAVAASAGEMAPAATSVGELVEAVMAAVVLATVAASAGELVEAVMAAADKSNASLPTRLWLPNMG